MSWHTAFDTGDMSKAQACSRSSPALFQVVSRVQEQTLKSSNIYWGSGPRPQNKLHPNADAEQRIETETSRKYYVHHEELRCDSEEKDKSTVGCLAFKALTENIVYR